jgi:hypothetical protein
MRISTSAMPLSVRRIADISPTLRPPTWTSPPRTSWPASWNWALTM